MFSMEFPLEQMTENCYVSNVDSKIFHNRLRSVHDKVIF